MNAPFPGKSTRTGHLNRIVMSEEKSLEKGFIKLYRSLQDNPFWTSEPFTRGQAWVDLLMLANHKQTFFYKREIKIEVPRGALARSIKELADRWKWSRTKVTKFLDDLEKESQIRHQKNNVTTLIYIENYCEYQDKKGATQSAGMQQESSSEAPAKQQEDTYKELNNVNNVKECKEDIGDKSPKKKTYKNLDYSSWPSEPDQTLLADWIKVRNSKKASNTQTAIEGLGRELTKCVKAGYTLEQCMREAIERSWTSCKLGWLQNQEVQPEGKKPGIQLPESNIELFRWGPKNGFPEPGQRDPGQYRALVERIVAERANG